MVRRVASQGSAASRTVRFAASLWMGFSLLVPATALCAKKEYPPEANPNRRGMAAIEQGRLPEAHQLFEEAISNEFEPMKANYGLGLVHMRQGEFREAEPLFRKALSFQLTDDEFPDGRAWLGVALLRMGRVREAKQQLEQARRAGDLWVAAYGLARLAILEKRYPDAEQLLAKGAQAKGLKEGEDLYDSGMALLHYAQSDYSAAEKPAMAAMKLNPSEPEVAALLSDIYVKLGAPELAVEAYRAALDAPGTIRTAPMLQALGAAYEKTGKYQEALKTYAEAAQLDSLYAPAYKSIGKLYVRAKKEETAVPYLLRYTKLIQSDADGYAELSKACLAIRKYRTAIDAAKQAFTLDSTQVDTRLALARASFYDRGKGRSAQLYATVKDTSLFDAADYTRRGQIALDRGDVATASKLVDKAVAMDPTLPDAYAARGYIAMKESKLDEAVGHLQKAAELAAKTPAIAARFQLNVGVALLQMKRTSEGIAVLRKAKSVAPDDAQIRIALGQALVAVDSVAVAASEFKAAVEREPKNGKALRFLASCQLKQSAFAEAATSLEAATVVEPDNADAWALLGQVYQNLKEDAKAQAALDKVRALNPNHSSLKGGAQTAKQAP
jgi:tetratricopeptide (TPR) repeat protein